MDFSIKRMLNYVLVCIYICDWFSFIATWQLALYSSVPLRNNIGNTTDFDDVTEQVGVLQLEVLCYFFVYI